MKRTKFLTILTIFALLLIIIILFTVKFISFPNPISSPKMDMADDTREIDTTITENYIYAEQNDFFKDVLFEQPHDVLITSYRTILVADASANCIYEFDMSGKLLKKIGKTGNGMLEFNFPTALCEHDGNIYVADNYNDRIQILSSITYEYSGEIFLDTKHISEAEYYTSIVSDGNSAIYISGNFMYTGDANVIKIITDPRDSNYKELQVIEPHSGTLLFDMETSVLYMAQTYELKASQGSYKRMRGTHYLNIYDTQTNDVYAVFEFPTKYMPSKIFKCEDRYISVSLTRETIDRFDENGNYIDTIYIADEFRGFHYAAIDYDETIYLSCPFEGTVLRLNKE